MSITPYHPQKKEEKAFALYTAYAPREQKQSSSQQGEVRALYARTIEGGSTRELASFAGIVLSVPPLKASTVQAARVCIATHNEGPKLTYPRAVALGALKGIAGPVVCVAGIIAHPKRAVHAVVDAPVQAICAISNTVNHPIDTTRKVAQIVSDINDMPGPEKTEKGVEFAVSLYVPVMGWKATKSALRVLPKSSAECHGAMSCKHRPVPRPEGTKHPPSLDVTPVSALPQTAQSRSRYRDLKEVFEALDKTAGSMTQAECSEMELFVRKQDYVKKSGKFENLRLEMLHIQAIASQHPKHFTLPHWSVLSQGGNGALPTLYMTKLPGLPLGDLLQTAPSEELKEMFKALGRAHGELHSMTQVRRTTKEAGLISDSLAKAHALENNPKTLAPYTGREVRDLILAKQEPRVLCVVHPEPHLDNAIWDHWSNQIALIDFEGVVAQEGYRLHMKHPREGFCNLLAKIHLDHRMLALPAKEQASFITFVWEGYRPFAYPLFAEDVRLSEGMYGYRKYTRLYDEITSALVKAESLSEQVSRVHHLLKEAK